MVNESKLDTEHLIQRDDIEENQAQRLSLTAQNSHYSDQNTVQQGYGVGLALIDPRSLMRISLSYLLGASALASRRSDDFVILPFSSAEELLVDCSRHLSEVKLIVFNIASACVRGDRVREDIGRLRLELPNIPLVILSEYDEPSQILETLRHGVRGYIPMSLSPSVVIQALRLIHAGGTFIPASALFHIKKEETSEERHLKGAKAVVLGCLTPRQLEVLRLLRQGKSNKVIAYELEMQESTVKVHVRHIMKKLKATNRTHAALLASEIGGTGLIECSPSIAPVKSHIAIRR